MKGAPATTARHPIEQVTYTIAAFSNLLGLNNFETYEQRANHMLPGVWGCGIGDILELHTLQVGGRLAHSSESAPRVRNARNKSLLRWSWNVPFVCR